MHCMEMNGQFHSLAAVRLLKDPPRYSLDRRLGGPQGWSGLCSEEKKNCPYRESNRGHPAHNLVTTLTSRTYGF
jgi:hypothetical protein